MAKKSMKANVGQASLSGLIFLMRMHENIGGVCIHLIHLKELPLVMIYGLTWMNLQSFMKSKELFQCKISTSVLTAQWLCTETFTTHMGRCYTRPLGKLCWLETKILQDHSCLQGRFSSEGKNSVRIGLETTGRIFKRCRVRLICWWVVDLQDSFLAGLTSRVLVPIGLLQLLMI